MKCVSKLAQQDSTNNKNENKNKKIDYYKVAEKNV